MSESKEIPLSPAQKAERRFREDFIDLMASPAFRRWLMVITDHPDWCATNADQSENADAAATNKWLGRRRIGLLLIRKAQEVAPGDFYKMEHEQQSLRAMLAKVQ